jgi:hypothetical protein
MSSNTQTFLTELLESEINTKMIRCRKYQPGYPSITPVINSLSITSSQQGIYTQVLVSGLNFFPFGKTVLNFGSYKNLPISYLSSFNISFVVPIDAALGNYDVQVANISTTQVNPTFFYSNIIEYTII